MNPRLQYYGVTAYKWGGFYLSLFSVIFLAVAVSMDGLGAGLACGLKRVRIPAIPVFLMGIAAGSAVLLSLLVGTFLGNFFGPRWAVLAGGTLLIILGLFMSWQAWRGQDQGGLLGLRTNPLRADADQSGSISCQEALVLGAALALDGFAAGFGAALAGYNPWLTGLAVAVTNVIFVKAGLRLGWMAAVLARKQILIIPGFLIVVLGVLKIIIR